MNEKPSKSKYRYPIVAFAITIVAGMIALFLSPAATTVSAAASEPVDPDIQLVEFHLLGVKSTSGEDVKFTAGQNFAQTYTIKSDQKLTGVKVGIKMKYGQEIPTIYQATVKITDPSGDEALYIPRDSSDWRIADWRYDRLVITHDAELTFTEAGTWTIEVELWYYN